MFRYFICSVRQETSAVLLVGDHVFFQLGCQLRALDDQHKLCVQIGAAQIEIVGAHGAQLIVNDIPIQLYGDFKEGRVSEGFGGVNPAFRGGYAFANLRELFPEPLSRAFMEGMEGFGTMIRGFDRPDAILAGIESRTSSPVRIPRDQGMESPVKGIFPCGEGAGYAGGITSAAMDGIKTAEEIIRRYSPLRPSRTVAKT